MTYRGVGGNAPHLELKGSLFVVFANKLLHSLASRVPSHPLEGAWGRLEQALAGERERKDISQLRRNGAAG